MDVAAAMGEVGLPEPLGRLAAREWDVVVVGGGHNGLTAAAYLAREGLSVLVLERSARLGGACTLERPFPDGRYVVSPCAYVVGLLDDVVVRDLGLAALGYRVFVADPNLWCPLADGRSVALYVDRERTVAHLRAQGFAEADIRGYCAYEDLFERLRLRLRSGPAGDTWHRSAPSRDELEAVLGDDELVAVAFEEPIAATLDRYIDDRDLKDALCGQGVIGTFAGPRDPGTAQVKLMHHQGDLLGWGSVWGYVEGGMGRISFAIAQAALEAGAVLAAGVEVAAIEPGHGVVLAGGERIRARAVVSNADPKRVLDMLPGDAPGPFRDRLAAWRVASPVVKLNAALRRLPAFGAAGGEHAARAMVGIGGGVDGIQAAVEAARAGEPRIGYLEVYFQTGYDPSVAPPGRHTMSVFAQYAPYELASGDWERRRVEIGELILDAIAEHAPDVRDCIEWSEVLGPPDIERRVGLTAGHIFQGEVLPDQMWDRRFDYRTPVEGLYMCGAATHPGGSVIGLNGRNAALAVADDLRLGGGW